MENRYVPILLIAFQAPALTPATSIQLDQPSGIVADAGGNLFIADTGNHIVRKVTPNGETTIIAGTGTAGSEGDGGPATSAQLNGPMGVAIDSSGNVFIADTANDHVRQVAADGIIKTIAADAKLDSPQSVAIAPSGDVIIADTANGRVLRVTSAGAISTVIAKLHHPGSVAVDRVGNVLVADTDGHRILRVTPAGVVQPIAGTGRAGFDGDGGPATAAQVNRPAGLALAGDDLLFADTDNHRVRRITAAGTISTIASIGAATAAAERGKSRPTERFDPSSVAADAAGHVWIADLTSNRVRLLIDNGFSATVAGLVPTRGFSGDGGPAIAARLSEPQGVGVDAAGNLYISDTGNGRIRIVTTDGIIRSIAGAGDAGLIRDDVPATRAQLNKPACLAVGADGSIIFAGGDRRVRRIEIGGAITTVAGNGSRQAGASGDGGDASDARIGDPKAVALGVDGIYIGGAGTSRVRRISADGAISTVAGNGTSGFSGDDGPATRARIEDVAGIALARDGTVYFIDAGTRIRRIDPDGKISTITSAGIKDATALAIDSNGDLIVADAGAHMLLRVDRSGAVKAFAGTGVRGIGGDGGPASAAQLDAPSALAFDENDNLFVADAGTDRVRRVSARGIITTVAGGGR